MGTLTSPKFSLTFRELGVSAISRGEKGTVALIVRDSASVVPFAIAQATQIPDGLSEANVAYIKRAFVGYVTPPKKVIVYCLTASGDLADALAYMETVDFDYLCGPADCSSDEGSTIASWIKSQRANNHAKFKAVLPNVAADDPGIINFTTEKLVEGKTTYTTGQYCSRIAGLLAGTPMSISATYAPLIELSDCTRYTREQRDDAVGKGELIAFWDGRKVKLDRAVNSYVTTVAGKLDSFKKAKLVEVMDMIRSDVHKTVEDDYIGKYANSYDNKMLLVAALRGYFEGLVRDRLVQEGYSVDIDVDRTEQYLMSKAVDTSAMTLTSIRQADTGSYVFIKISCKILDAIEDIEITIDI